MIKRVAEGLIVFCAVLVVGFLLLQGLPRPLPHGEPLGAAAVDTASPAATTAPQDQETAQAKATPNSPSAIASERPCDIASMLVDLKEAPDVTAGPITLPSSVLADLKLKYSDRQVLETAQAPLSGRGWPVLANGNVVIVLLSPSTSPRPGSRPNDPATIESCAAAFYDSTNGAFLMTYVRRHVMSASSE
jgi:hypothetical protein